MEGGHPRWSVEGLNIRRTLKAAQRSVAQPSDTTRDSPKLFSRFTRQNILCADVIHVLILSDTMNQQDIHYI